MKFEFSLHIFEKFSNIKFHDTSTSGSPVVPCRRTDRYDEANSSYFCNFLNACINDELKPKNTVISCRVMSFYVLLKSIQLGFSDCPITN